MMGFRNFTSVFIFAAFLAAASHDICEQQPPPCSPEGPAIKFPFWLKDKQPEHCGYPGLHLYCDNSSHTVLEFSSSVKLFVKHIIYESHRIQLYDPQGCLPKQIRNFNTYNASPLQFSSWDRFTFFNCSLANNQSTNWSENVITTSFDIGCLDTPGYKVHATSSSNRIDFLPLKQCKKMYSMWASWDMFSWDNLIQMSWSLPACENCERKGGICTIKNATKYEINCVGNINSDTKKKKLITTGVLGSLILLLATSTTYYLYSRKRRDKENQARINKFLEDYKEMTPSRYSYLDLKRITNDFKEQLGEGAYGIVYKGKISEKVLVAVKLLHDSTRKGEEFINEVATMGKIHHVNVVRLIGFCADGFRRALVYEFLPNGSLEKFISTKETLGLEKMQDIALGIARGIEYLHQGCEQRILHFDIKPQNILLDDNFNPKISDFGVAKLCEKGKSAVSMTAARGTMGYMAPEVYSRQFGNVSSKSDIYSFGMLLLEMIGCRKYINERAQNVSPSNFQESIYKNLANNEKDLAIQIGRDGDDNEIHRKLAAVGLLCIQWNPMDRPSITNVLEMLQGNSGNLNIPPSVSTSRIHLEVISESE